MHACESHAMFATGHCGRPCGSCGVAGTFPFEFEHWQPRNDLNPDPVPRHREVPSSPPHASQATTPPSGACAQQGHMAKPVGLSSACFSHKEPNVPLWVHTQQTPLPVVLMHATSSQFRGVSPSTGHGGLRTGNEACWRLMTLTS